MARPSDDEPAVVVVGGGYAGMAAAFALSRRGVRTTVYEAARQLGGRARSVRRNSLELDNGQHILVGAYRETLRLIDDVGAPSDSLLRLPLRWTFPPNFDLRPPSIPGPWDLVLGLLRAHGISMAARLRCGLFIAWCRRRAFRLPEDMSVSALLLRQGQHPDAIRYLWSPLCEAALNTPPQEASAQVFLNVIRDGLAASRAQSDLVLPRTDLTRLFPARSAEHVVRCGGRVHLGRAASRIVPDSSGFTIVAPGGEQRCDAVIIATQPSRVAALTTDLTPLSASLGQIAALTYQSIVTVYLQYARTRPLPFPMLGMSGEFGQWLFDRSALTGQAGLLAVVISAYPRGRRLPHDELSRRVQAEVAAIVPQLGTPEWVQVIEEKQATFACTPHLQRPDQRTEVPGLFLAGDYTAGEYPATLEAAVRSGLRCAELAVAHLRR